MSQDQAHGLLDSTGNPIARMPNVVKPGTNGIVRNEAGEILLQRRADNGLWGLPGGVQDVGESARDGAIREVFEETGLTVSVTRLIGVYSDPHQYAIDAYPGGHTVHYVTAVFECERIAGELTLSGESTDLGYFPPDALPDVTPPGVRLRVRDALAGRAAAFIR
ncbi:MAG: NUDIX domain-containing protein [Chloroflexi bacterium]|nr:NUDIX domain-containing protein [Chloroflexota bacterium]